jgi:hypothetical protein
MSDRVETITTTRAMAGQICTKCLICEEYVVIGDISYRGPAICRKCKKAVIEMRQRIEDEVKKDG